MNETIETILESVAATAPEIRRELPGRREKGGSENPSGETQLAADVWADEHFASHLCAIDGVGEYVSEERDEVVHAGTGLRVAIDPLDGSSNLRSNNSMGTILGIYDAPLPASGRDLVAAAYLLYGPITTMVVAVGDEVTEYVVEDGDLHVVTENLTLPAEPTVYGFGGRVPDWTSEFEAYAREVETELKLRYGGAMIGDVNQVLTYGGVFSYPALQSAPEGKLRLQFEANPIAYIVEAAGGRSSDGEQSILDVAATDVHQRVPVHVGNASLVDRLEAALAE